jgi:hypothetical protein
MKPSNIFDVMDLARRARQKNLVFNPLFEGPPGIGKSQIVQEWCKKNNLPFIDLRAAYLESPDLIGFPSIEVVKGRQVTKHHTPEFFPTEGEGVLLLEEPNRGTTSVMNTFMQLLTDRKVHNYELPPGWIIVGCINPEGEQYDTNHMDAALKDRFEIFKVGYDKKSFVEHMKASDWDSFVVSFVETNTFSYVAPEDVGSIAGSKYISPRTLSKLNAALKAGIPEIMEIEIYESVLGKNVGKAFYQFKHDEAPVGYKDLLDKEKKSLAKLKTFSDPQNYKMGHISITVKDIVDNGEISDELLAKVILAIPADQGPHLISELEFKRKEKAGTILDRVCGNFPEVRKYLRDILAK